MNNSTLNDISNFTVQHEDDTSCGGASDLEVLWFLNFSWWIEGFLQLVTGAVFFFFNSKIYHSVEI